MSDPNDLLIARPIDEAAVIHIESQTEVASSVAFQCVDEQFYAGKLTSTEVAMYKARYMKIHEALKKTRDNEFNLIRMIKRFISEIETQEQQLNKADQFPDNAVTEPSQMRAQILNYYNTAMETDERVEMLIYEAGLLKEERKLLNRDYSRLPTSELELLDEDVDICKEMERRTKVQQNQCQDLWLDIDVLKMEAKRTREQYRTAIDLEHEVISEHGETNGKLNSVKAEWVIATDLPGQYSKEAEKARKYKSNAEKELVNLLHEFSELRENQTHLEQMLRELETEEEINRNELLKTRRENAEKKQALEDATKLYETWYELEMLNRTEKARLLQRLHLAEQSKKDLLEEQNKLTRDREICNRNLKKSHLQIEFIAENLKLVKQIHDKTRARYVVTPKYDGELLAKKRRLARAIQIIQQDLDEERKRAVSEGTRVGQTITVNERRLAILEHLRAENWELIRLTQTLSESLGKAISEYSAARTKHDRLVEDLQMKTMEMKENQKILDELNGRLNEVSLLYTKMKLERNKCVGLLQTSVKLAMDTRERLRLYSNEAEILIFGLQKCDQNLIRERTMYSNAIVQRDHKRSELCKLANIHSQQLAKRDQMVLTIQRINLMFNQTEAETLSLKKAKERNARIRNERAILLIERNQEVYILQERISAQETAGKSAELSLHGVEEECEFIRRYKSQLMNYIGIINRNAPTLQALKTQLQGLIHELIAGRAHLRELVEKAENPDSHGRLRLLKGKDPSQAELWSTLGHLERRMGEKEEDMAEKNLTYEAICRLVDSLQVKANAGRDDTLILATEVNKVKTHLKLLRNHMKTSFAELVIMGNERNNIKKNIEKLEHQLDLYELRTRQGKAPCPDMEDEINRIIEANKIKKEYRQQMLTGPPKIQPMRSSRLLPTLHGSSSKNRSETIHNRQRLSSKEPSKTMIVKAAEQNQSSAIPVQKSLKLPPLNGTNENNKNDHNIYYNTIRTNDKCDPISNMLYEQFIEIRPVTFTKVVSKPKLFNRIQYKNYNFKQSMESIEFTNDRNYYCYHRNTPIKSSTKHKYSQHHKSYDIRDQEQFKKQDFEYLNEHETENKDESDDDDDDVEDQSELTIHNSDNNFE